MVRTKHGRIWPDRGCSHNPLQITYAYVHLKGLHIGFPYHQKSVAHWLYMVWPMVSAMRLLRPCGLVLALWLGGTGCSVLFVEAPPADYAERRSFTCSTSRLAPLGDTALAAILGIATANVIVGPPGSNDSQDLVSAVLVTTGIAASAIRGFAATSECREAKRTFEERFDNHTPLSPFPVLPPGSDPWLAWGLAPPVAPAPAPRPNSDTNGLP